MLGSRSGEEQEQRSLEKQVHPAPGGSLQFKLPSSGEKHFFARVLVLKQYEGLPLSRPQCAVWFPDSSLVLSSRGEQNVRGSTPGGGSQEVLSILLYVTGIFEI